MQQRYFRASDLVPVYDPRAFMRPYCAPLVMGDHSRLNSGGPILLVVDVSDQLVTVAWPDDNGRPKESTVPAACLYRAFA